MGVTDAPISPRLVAGLQLLTDTVDVDVLPCGE